ncbi:putative UNC93-like protein MFSD11 [Hypsibius exemplaris]|uniref:UNC93-like protein MFSD11 n=1 Tax=Hypsibius exemplaris TaxID=2072580 RepID=A0A1W0WYB6_HYPEX|nr:putative UNC93-like protein MFSD11 [Hypsibius exemplaris]
MASALRDSSNLYTDLFSTTETPKFPPLPVARHQHFGALTGKVADIRDHALRNAEIKARRQVQFWNLVQTGLAYMFLLSSVQTALSVGTLLLANVNDGLFQGTSTLGYSVLGVTYCVLAVAFWLAQPVVSTLGPVNSMIISAVCFIIFLLVFIRPIFWLLFIAAVVAGFGAAILSTAGGVFMALNSDSETIGRNTGIFFGLYETSLIWGNIGFFVILRGSNSISTEQRYWIVGFLLVLGSFGTILVLLLKRKQAQVVIEESEFAHAIDRGFLDSIKASALLCLNPNVIMLLPLIIFLGLSSAFRNDIYNTAIGYTLEINSLSLVGLAGVMLGLGELTGSAICAGINTKMPHMSRGKMVVGGVIASCLGYFFIYLNMPNEAVLGPTHAVGVINPPSKFLAVFCSFLMGIGDAAVNTQIYAILAELFGHDIVPPVGLFQSIYALFCAVAYFYSTALKIYAQLLILIISAIAGAWSFSVMATKFVRSQRYEDI